jgi:hypothetical protein
VAGGAGPSSASTRPPLARAWCTRLRVASVQVVSLDRLLGTWDVTMRHRALPEPVLGRQTCERVLDGAFVLLRSSYDHPDVPDAIAVLDERACHSFDVRGVSRLFDVAVDDAGWAMVRRDEDFWQRSAARFTGPDAMEGNGENSYDRGESWEHDYSMTWVRVGSPPAEVSRTTT